MIQRFLPRYFRQPGRIESPQDLTAFLTERSAYVAQRASIEYCRAKAGVNWDHLFREDDFLAGLEQCRWAVLPVALADVAAMIALRLDPQEENAAAGMVRIAAAALDRHSPPGPGWSRDTEVARISRRIAEARDADADAAALATPTVAVLLATLPIHPRLRGHDREMIGNFVRFCMVTIGDEFDRRCDAGRLASQLATHGRDFS